jgi:hypothetical protein
MYNSKDYDHVLRYEKSGLSNETRQTSEIPKNYIELRLCETEFLILKPNVFYMFTVDPNCSRCIELEEIGKQILPR